MSRHRRPRRSAWMTALVILVGVPVALFLIGMVSFAVTGLILIVQFVSDLTRGY